jgi:hypothetical protein
MKPRSMRRWDTGGIGYEDGCRVRVRCIDCRATNATASSVVNMRIHEEGSGVVKGAFVMVRSTVPPKDSTSLPVPKMAAVPYVNVPVVVGNPPEASIKTAAPLGWTSTSQSESDEAPVAVRNTKQLPFVIFPARSCGYVSRNIEREREAFDRP